MPDEELIATAMELIALHDSFDAAGDKNGEKVDITPERDSTPIDSARYVELRALQGTKKW